MYDLQLFNFYYELNFFKTCTHQDNITQHKTIHITLRHPSVINARELEVSWQGSGLLGCRSPAGLKWYKFDWIMGLIN